jgi:hypothetical protein
MATDEKAYGFASGDPSDKTTHDMDETLSEATAGEEAQDVETEEEKPQKRSFFDFMSCFS